LGRSDDLEQLAVVRPTDHGVADAGRLQPARARFQPADSDAFEVALKPALEAVDHLELHIVVVPRAELRPERCRHPDHVRLRKAAGGFRDAEVTVSGVVAQATRLEVALVQVTDDATGSTARFSRSSMTVS
jgi:hypothetical protein